MRINKHDLIIPLILVLILFLLIGTGWSINYFLTKGVHQLVPAAENLQALIFKEQWDKALVSFHQLKDTWREMSKYWPLVIHHQDLNQIEECLAKLEMYLQYQVPHHSQAELETLITFIRYIPERESWTLKNIF